MEVITKQEKDSLHQKILEPENHAQKSTSKININKNKESRSERWSKDGCLVVECWHGRWLMADGWWLLNSSSLFSSNVFGKMKVNRERERRDSEFGWGWSGYAREGRWASHYTYVKSFFFFGKCKILFSLFIFPSKYFFVILKSTGDLTSSCVSRWCNVFDC